MYSNNPGIIAGRGTVDAMPIVAGEDRPQNVEEVSTSPEDKAQDPYIVLVSCLVVACYTNPLEIGKGLGLGG